MSEQLPERADMRQLRIQAKELLRSLTHGEKLADAQLLIARKYGFLSWPKLVDHLETPKLLEKFKHLVYTGDAEGLDKLLKSKASLRKHIDDPLFDFDSPAIVQSAHHPQAKKLLPILVKHGANPNARTKWWAGSFGALDLAYPDVVDTLVDLGAKFDTWSAAKHGRVDLVREFIAHDPLSVNAPGGDGQRPLHVAANAETAKLLVENGAELEIRDVDHEATPIQYQANNPEVLRVLLEAGAKPDVFTAVVLDDVTLLETILKENPQAANSRTGKGAYTTTKSNGGHIYIYVLGSDKTPQQVAAERGSKAVLGVLLETASPAKRLVAAAWLEDEETVKAILKENPNIGNEMGADARSITDAAQAGKTETVRLLLEAGLDPMTPGLDAGSALHLACWFGYIEVVRLLVNKVPLDLCDATHGSPPLGWACHGSNFCRNSKGDYLAVIKALIEAGADIHAPGNSGGTTMIEQAGNREDVKELLRSYGAQ